MLIGLLTEASSHRTKERSVKSSPWTLAGSEWLTWRQQGGKNRRRGKNENDDDKRELVFREDGQEYAQVIKMLGNGRLEAQCFDGEKRLAHIRGKMRKKVCSFACSHFHSKEKWRSLNCRSGLDQSGRYCIIVSARIPGRKGRCDCEIHSRRGSESYVSLLDLQHQMPTAPPTVKAYGELPENAKINETDAFGEEDGECAFEFGDEGEMDIDDI